MSGDYRFPNWPIIPTRPAVFDDSAYMRKCKRRRTDGPTPCYCCPGECVGEPRNAAEAAEFLRAFEARMSATPSRKKDCPWAWTFAFAAVAFVVVGILGKGIFH